jgi:hypothetical protein
MNTSDDEYVPPMYLAEFYNPLAYRIKTPLLAGRRNRLQKKSTCDLNAR